jgi:hypothetical protein
MKSMVAKDLASKVQFPSFEQLMIAAVFGTALGIIMGLWLKNALDKRIVHMDALSRKIPYMARYKKDGLLTVIWRMIGA